MVSVGSPSYAPTSKRRAIYVRLPLYAQYCSSLLSLAQRSINEGGSFSRWRSDRWFSKKLRTTEQRCPGVCQTRHLYRPVPTRWGSRPERVALEEIRMRRRCGSPRLTACQPAASWCRPGLTSSRPSVTHVRYVSVHTSP